MSQTPISFEDQAVIVTGGGQGLGRAYALELARRGAMVVVNDLAGLEPDSPTGPAADAVVREIEAMGGKAVASHHTVASPEGGQAMTDLALETFGTIDAVIHNAGIWRHFYFHDMTSDLLDPVLDVHLRGAFFVARPAWKHMMAKGYGRIVLTSSSTGAFGRLAGTNYAAAKAAMLGLAKAMALEGEEHGIKTNCILPVAPFRKRGAVPAEITQKLHSMGLSAEEAGPEQVAPIVAWLASKACSVSGEAYSAGAGRFGKMLVAVADGWIKPGEEPASAEDIAEHLAEIRDVSRYSIPPSAIDELGEIAQMRKRKG